MKFSELKMQTPEQRHAELLRLRELYQVKAMQLKTSALKNTAELRIIRRDIARLNTATSQERQAMSVTPLAPHIPLHL